MSQVMETRDYGVPARPELGLRPGAIFTLRNRNARICLNQHNHLHPYYLDYINREGEVIHDHTEVKRLLHLVSTCCTGQDCALLQGLVPRAARQQEVLPDWITRVAQATSKRRGVEKTQARLAKEKQFNRKVEINATLQQLKTELDKLSR